jgi:hypothetical protein
MVMKIVDDLRLPVSIHGSESMAARQNVVIVS